ncbi:hypothetical protein ACKWTF_015893 [Chironomus riparius]
MSKASRNLLQTITNSTACLILTLMFILITIYPQQSTQDAIISKSSVIQAPCIYNYTSSDIYTCKLHILVSINSMDVLEITGTHLDNHTDADVEDVYQTMDAPGFFEGSVLRKFENLKSIYFYGSGLREINQNAFNNCPKLERLSIGYGQLSFFPPGMLKNCENLNNLEVTSQKIETFPEDIFGNTKNLENFQVSVNELTSLPEKLLHNMEKLKTIRIAYNKLTELSPNFFINTPNLEEVSAYGNEFHHQEDITYALNGKIKLTNLWIDDNNFTSFDFRFFAQFQKLEYLSIGMRSDFKLTEIHWQSLPASLTNLRVYGVGEDIPENSFDRLLNMNTLILNGIGITTLHKDLFKQLTSLVFLSIYDTGLKALHAELFANQINLSNLLIRDSYIEDLPPGIFTPLVNIGTVNTNNGIQIISSKIQRLNAKSFGEYPHLKYIDFSYNEINEIERGLFSKFHPDMSFAGFYSNVCVSKYFSGEDLDNSENLELCFKNWEEIDPNNRTTTVATPIATTTLGGCGRNFRSFEIFMIIFVGIFKFLSNYFHY